MLVIYIKIVLLSNNQQLVESYCLPILLYATTAYHLSLSQLNDLNVGWNSVYRRIFGFNKWESVTSFIGGLGRLNFKCLRDYSCLKFIKQGTVSSNNVFRILSIRHFMCSTFKVLCNRFGIVHSVQTCLHNFSCDRLKCCVIRTFAQN